MISNMDDFLEEKGFLLDTEEYALAKKDALLYIELLYSAGCFILGGDVYLKEDENFFPAYDSWYCQTNSHNQLESKHKAELFVSNYKNNNSFFVVVSKC